MAQTLGAHTQPGLLVHVCIQPVGFGEPLMSPEQRRAEIPSGAAITKLAGNRIAPAGRSEGEVKREV